MNPKTSSTILEFNNTLGLDELPMGMFYTNKKPDQGYCPDPCELPTREDEKKNQVNWQEISSNFACAIGKIWLAHKKKTAAYFAKKQFGCLGGAFWMGFNKPQLEGIIHYVSSGIPGQMEGEHYCDSPNNLRQIFEQVDPVNTDKEYCVFKPLDQFAEDEEPLLVSFFTRPESLTGLHQLAAFVTNDPEVVSSPWSAACGSLVAWPLHYLEKRSNKAVIGGWDPSARKFFKTDELTFTIPYTMFVQMLESYKSSFLMTKTWQIVLKKINKNKKTWGEV